jgi:D-tyrosyl-tRNA(Tyr) deacylase
MRVLLQRVSSAAVRVDAETVGAIGRGLLLLVGFGRGDDARLLAPMADKVTGLRVFPDPGGRLQHSVLDIQGGVLAVPQFTLYGSTQRGRRPDFAAALEPAAASGLFARFVDALAATGLDKLESGRFGAQMSVQLVNDGPVTLLLER